MSFFWNFYQNTNADSNQKETPDKPKLKDILQNNVPVLIKYFEIIKEKGKTEDPFQIKGH